MNKEEYFNLLERNLTGDYILYRVRKDEKYITPYFAFGWDAEHYVLSQIKTTEWEEENIEIVPVVFNSSEKPKTVDLEEVIKQKKWVLSEW